MNELVHIALTASFWILLLLFAATMIIVAIGPGNIDRLVAADLSLIIVSVDLAIFSALQESPFYMDAALLIAVVSFLVTVAVARLLEQGEGRR